jgi:predicted ribosome quality control (RQC) complex YloA/Tae2 family protein
VGKGGNENDRLTFRIASPEDFWLHADGAAGAHVVVAQSEPETRLPAPTLREAAELAAFYSKAKDKGRCEVLVTRRKYVRRIRGRRAGTVTVKKHESVLVSPKNPFDGLLSGPAAPPTGAAGSASGPGNPLHHHILGDSIDRPRRLA